MKTLVLCSGGLDSVVLAAHLQTLGHSVSLFFVNYGQRCLENELLAVKSCAKALNAELLIKDLPGLFGRSCALVDNGTPDPGGKDLAGQAAWVPARNLVLVSLAVVEAVTKGFGEIQIGNIGEGVYSDNKPIFRQAFNLLLPAATGLVSEQLHVSAAFDEIPKAKVLEIGVALKAPIFATWSCYRPGPRHCGTCASCLGRARSFKAAGVLDKTPYLESPAI